MKKGFTLIELLAVIVVITIIALISVPIILNVIDKSRRGAVKSSTHGILESAIMYYTKNMDKDIKTEVLIKKEDNLLNYKGNVDDFTLSFNEDGDTAAIIYIGKYCGYKYYGSNEIKIGNVDNSLCYIDDIAINTEDFLPSSDELTIWVHNVNDNPTVAGALNEIRIISGLNVVNYVISFNEPTSKEIGTTWIELDSSSLNKIIMSNMYIPIGKVRQYDGTKWVTSTAYIYNGTEWKMFSNGNIYEEIILNGAIPELYQGLIPISISTSGVVTVADQSTEWYKYSNHNWANSVLVNVSDTTIKAKYFNTDMTLKENSVGSVIAEGEILQYYVWIPRYKYKLWNVNNESSSEQAIDIVFENKDVSKSTVVSNGNYYTHPAFTFGTSELNGIWVGKFETSGTTTSLKIKPNSVILTNINVSSMFSSARNMELVSSANFGINSDEIDTHMSKNMEWGAITYLTNSIYGRYTNSTTCIASGCEVWINNTNTYASGTNGPSITGCSGASVAAAVINSTSACTTGYSWAGNGVNASTTGNIAGIYDMSGGNWESVMGNMVYSNGNFYVSSSGFVSIPDSKYYDSYAYSASAYLDHNRGLIGDATKETLKIFGNTSGGWYSDTSNLPNESNSWVLRGGNNNNETHAGIFTFSRSGGGANTSYSFRVVLTAN